MGGVAKAFSGRDKKAEERADDVARQTTERAQQIAADAKAGIQQATALTPDEANLRAASLQAVQGRLGVPGETLYNQQGPISTETAAQILQRIRNPGMDWTSTTAQETQKALEEGVLPTFAARGISPTSPIVAEEGRREARDIAIKNAALKLASIQTDIGRGQDFGNQVGGLEELARSAGINIGELARQRQAAGSVDANTLAAQLQQQGSLAQTTIQGQAVERQAELMAAQRKLQQQMITQLLFGKEAAPETTGSKSGGGSGGSGNSDKLALAMKVAFGLG